MTHSGSQSRKLRILIHSILPGAHSGYGKTCLYFARWLSKRYDVGVFAITGLNLVQLQFGDVPVFPNYTLDRGQSWMKFWFDYFKADVIFSHMDVHALGDFIKRSGLPFVVYQPIDSVPLPEPVLKSVEGALKVVVPTKFAQELFREQEVQVIHIPQCVDTKIYHARDKTECRRRVSRIFGPIPEDSFVFLIVAANLGPRKNIPNMVKAYNMFLNQNPGAERDTVLLCWTYPIHDDQQTQCYNLPTFGKHFGLSERNLRLVDPRSYIFGLEEEEMATLYGAADVLLQATFGEGFGLPIIEAGATGVPTISTAFSSMPELIGDSRGLLVDVAEMVPFQRTSSWQAVPSTQDLAKKMGILYHDRELTRELGDNAREFAQGLDWEVIMPKWEALFDGLWEEK